MAKGIDFMAMARGARLADNDNWENIRRIQQQQKKAIEQEDDLAGLKDRRVGREAAMYLSTLQPNLARLGEVGPNGEAALDPVDAMIAQYGKVKEEIAGMPGDVQTQILRGFDQSAVLQMQALKNSGNYEGMRKLAAGMGAVNPINPLGEAIASGDPRKVLEAVNAISPGTAVLSQDGKFVVNPQTGAQVPVENYVASVAGARSASGGFNAWQQQGQEDRTNAAAGVLKTEEQQREQENMQLEIAKFQQLFPGQPVPAIYYKLAGIEPPTTAAGATGTATGFEGMPAGMAGWAEALKAAPPGGGVMPPMLMPPGYVAPTAAAPSAAPSAAPETPAMEAEVSGPPTAAALREVSQIISEAKAADIQPMASTIRQQILAAESDMARLSAQRNELGKMQTNGDPFAEAERMKQLQLINAEYAEVSSSLGWRNRFLRQLTTRDKELSAIDKVSQAILPKRRSSVADLAEIQRSAGK